MRVMKTLRELVVDEEFRGLIPPLQESELALLEESLLEDGCETPLVVWDGILIDGHNRYQICQKHNIPFAVLEKDFASRDDAKLWVIKNQLGRRNLTGFQRGELLIPLEELVKAETKERQKAGISAYRHGNEKVPILGPSQKSEDILAEMAGMSHGTFNKVKRLVKEADEDTKEKLRKGELSINKAYTDLLATKDPQEAEQISEQDAEPENDAVPEAAPDIPDVSTVATDVTMPDSTATVQEPNVSDVPSAKSEDSEDNQLEQGQATQAPQVPKPSQAVPPHRDYENVVEFERVESGVRILLDRFIDTLIINLNLICTKTATEKNKRTLLEMLGDCMSKAEKVIIDKVDGFSRT